MGKKAALLKKTRKIQKTGKKGISDTVEEVLI
jgi:hypothetical protein